MLFLSSLPAMTASLISFASCALSWQNLLARWLHRMWPILKLVMRMTHWWQLCQAQGNYIFSTNLKSPTRSNQATFNDVPCCALNHPLEVFCTTRWLCLTISMWWVSSTSDIVEKAGLWRRLYCVYQIDCTCLCVYSIKQDKVEVEPAWLMNFVHFSS